MVEWMSSWAQGIIIAVIIATIIELLLPAGNGKKYMKVVIGIYLVFTIISPILDKVTGKSFSLENILETENNSYKEKISLSEGDKLQVQNDTNIKEIYVKKLKSDIKEKILSQGFIVEEIQIEIQKDQTYTVDTIFVKISKKEENVEEVQNTEEVVVINTIEIAVSNTITETQKEKKVPISDQEIKQLKEYLSKTYDVKMKKITIEK